MTKIVYIFASQRRMLCCKMSLQLDWNYSIVTKFFSTQKNSESGHVASPHQKEPKDK
jgi:hypothetical protein